MSQESIPEEESSNLVSVTGSAIEPPDVSDRQQVSDQLHLKVMKLRDDMASSYFEMGALLYQMSLEGLWAFQKNPATKKPYEKFSEYVESEVGFQYRKAKYLMSTWYWFAKKIGSPRVSEKIKEIGWTKAAALVGVVDEKNVDAWVEKAKLLNTTKFNQECKLALAAASRKRRPTLVDNPTADEIKNPVEKLGLDGKPLVSGAHPSPIPNSGDPENARMGVDPLADGELRDTRRRWGVIVTGDQEDNVNAAIDAASEMAGVNSDGKGFLLDFIATHFLSFVGGAAAENASKQKRNFMSDFLTKAEEYLGVDIIAMERGTNDVVFGNDTVERIQGDDA